MTIDESMFKAIKVDQKIQIVIPPYMKDMDDFISICVGKDLFGSKDMTLDYMVNNLLKDFKAHPKLE